MSALRILELRSTYRDGGGPDKTILLSAAQHDRRAYEVHCLYLRGAWDDAFNIGKRAAKLGVSFEEVLEQRALDPRAWTELVARARHFRPDIVHTHDYKTDVLGLLLRPFMRHAVLMATAHGWTQDNSRMNLYNQLDRRALRLYDHVVAVSEATAAHLTVAGISPSRMSILYNGIDVTTWSPQPFEPARQGLLERFQLPSSARLVGFIGRLSAEKDVPTALSAMTQVIKQCPEAHLLVVGEGAMQAELHRLAAGLGIASQVHGVGHQVVHPGLYAGLEVYLMSSLTEGLPNTLLEAMACGRPSVATRVGGIPELVGRSGSVLLAEAGDANGLAQAVLELLGHPSRAAQLGQAARTRIEEQFSFAQRLRLIEGLYSRLAQERASTRRRRHAHV